MLPEEARRLMKKCRICGREFDKSEIGRLRILRKERKGESVIWICPECSKRIKIH